MSTWEEIKLLAADFQKVQLSSTTQKLSERNCVEIISLLTEKKLIDLIFTTDGKEFITPPQLVRDIIGELYDSGGRVNLVELAKNLNVDLAHINAVLGDVTKTQKDIQCILGQLVDSSYITRIAAEINQKLNHQGQVNVSELTLLYDLPAEFLQQHVLEKNLGKLIFAQQDSKDARLFFTESFVARSKAKIRGALSGITKPTSVATILNHIDMTDKLFFSLFDQCSVHGTLTSRQSGAQYMPNIYARSQNEWVSNFYKQNGYLEFDALTRLGITDYRTYIKKQLYTEDIHYLHSCGISKNILERVQADIEECIASKSYIDLQNDLPSVFGLKDIELLLNMVLTPQKRSQTIVIDNFIISKAFIEGLSKHCEDLVKENAKAVVESGKYQQYQISLKAQDIKTTQKVDDEKFDKREDRRKKASGGKSGGGLQGRETKTKSTKKFPRGGNKHIDEDIDTNLEEKKTALEVISANDIAGILHTLLENEGLEDLMEPLVQHLHPQLNQQGVDIAASIFATTVADQTANRRQTHNELQNKINVLIDEVRLFEKGLKLLPSDSQPALIKYLLKTLCTDIVSELISYVAAETNVNVVASNLNHDQRVKFVTELSNEYKPSFLPLIKALSGQSIDDFITATEGALVACSMILKKIDKKRDRIVILNHKHELLDQLDKCEDLALVLHLSVLIIFISATQCMVHASGRHVAQILAFLKQYVRAEEMAELSSYHDFVTLMLSGGSEAENAKEKLKEKLSCVKQIAAEFKKRTSESH